MATIVTTGVEHKLRDPIPPEAFTKQLPVMITFMAVEYAGPSRKPTPIEVTIDIRLPVDSAEPHRLWKISGTAIDGRIVVGQIDLDDPERSYINIQSTVVLPRQPH